LRVQRVLHLTTSKVKEFLPALVLPRGGDWMYTPKSCPLRGEMPHTGDPAYATAADGARSLSNEGFAIHARGAGARGMGVGQRDGGRENGTSEETIVPCRTGVGPRRRASHPDTACVREHAPAVREHAPAPAAPEHEVARPEGASGPLRRVLRLRTFAALHHR